MSKTTLTTERRRKVTFGHDDPTAFELYCAENPDRNVVVNFFRFICLMIGMIVATLSGVYAMSVTGGILAIVVIPLWYLGIRALDGRPVKGKLRKAQMFAAPLLLAIALVGGVANAATGQIATALGGPEKPTPQHEQQGGGSATESPHPKAQAPTTHQGTTTQSFGANPSTYKKFGVKGHTGVDIAADCGVPAFAPASGSVTAVGDDPEGYGQYVDLATYAGERIRTSHYAAGSIGVKPGDVVAIGQQWAAVGTTGNSTGCHVHFELHPRNENVKNGYGGAVDPASWKPLPCALKGIPAAFGEYICGASAKYPVNPALLAAIVGYENRFNLKGWPAKPMEYPWPCSPAGACGPAQFMPKTFAHYGVDGPSIYPGDGGGDAVADRHSVSDAIYSSARYLSEIAAKKPSPAEVAKEYNCGPRCYQRSDQWLIENHYGETLDYYKKVLILRAQYSG